MASAVSRAVLAHRNIKGPVEVVLDGPVRAHDAGDAFGGNERGQDEETGADSLFSLRISPNRFNAGHGARVFETADGLQVGREHDPGTTHVLSVMFVFHIADSEVRRSAGQQTLSVRQQRGLDWL